MSNYDSPLEIQLTSLTATVPEGNYRMGSPRYGVNQRFLTRNGKPWLPVMGEMHYARTPRAEWREELRKLKHLGLDIVSTYSFWIHHEEIEGEFDFSGCRDLGEFVRLAQEVGLLVWLRIGPWAHGECRNGGFPDWLVNQKLDCRNNDPAYLARVKRYWQELFANVNGAFEDQDGPVVGIQVENELMEDAPHLARLRALAEEIGFRAPYWTATGWGSVDIPDGEVLPVFGGYADGFWEREGADWPVRYRQNFFFRHVRNDTAIGSDHQWNIERPDSYRAEDYPYLTCETGGGMPSSFHRRIVLDPRDTEALATTGVGSGSNMPGYYMVHGGQNPVGKLSTYEETQATGYPNDLPTVTYFANSPVGDFGQINESFPRLQLFHRFLHTVGERLAPMVAELPPAAAGGLMDCQELRWSVRHQGQSGFLFVNNHQPRETLPDHHGVQWHLQGESFDLTFPRSPVSIPSGAILAWPFGLELAPGLVLKYITAQPIQQDGNTWTFVTLDDLPPQWETICGEGWSQAETSKHGTSWSNPELGEVHVRWLAKDYVIQQNTPPRKRLDALTWHVTTEQTAATFEIKRGSAGVAQAPEEGSYESGLILHLKPEGEDPDGLTFIEVDYVGCAARAYIGERLVSDDFYSSVPWKIRLDRDWPAIRDSGLTFKIIEIPTDHCLYFGPSLPLIRDFGAKFNGVTTWREWWSGQHE